MLNLLKHDIRQGTIRMWQGYLFAFVICCCSSVYLKNVIDSMNFSGSVVGSGTLIDYYMYSLKGMEVYKLTKDSFFQIPVYWFCYHIMLAYTIGRYTEKDITDYGKNSILATKTRTGWWLAKCLWCIFSVILYYFMGFLGAMFYTVFANGKISLCVTIELMKYFGQGLIYLSNDRILIMVLLLPCLISIAISMLQMLLSIKIGSVASFASICILYILSAYYTSPFLLGNYTMWRRNNVVSISSDIYMIIGILISILLILITIIMGIIYMDKKDII